jgi:hypothetical protein
MLFFCRSERDIADLRDVRAARQAMGKFATPIRNY